MQWKSGVYIFVDITDTLKFLFKTITWLRSFWMKLQYSAPSLIGSPYLPRNCGHLQEVAFEGEKKNTWIVVVETIYGFIKKHGLCWEWPLIEGLLYGHLGDTCQESSTTEEEFEDEIVIIIITRVMEVWACMFPLFLFSQLRLPRARGRCEWWKYKGSIPPIYPHQHRHARPTPTNRLWRDTPEAGRNNYGDRFVFSLPQKLLLLHLPINLNFKAQSGVWQCRFKDLEAEMENTFRGYVRSVAG